MMNWIYVTTGLALTTMCGARLEDPVQVRVVHEATNYQSRSFNYGQRVGAGRHYRMGPRTEFTTESSGDLQLKAVPANFSGPSQLEQLTNHCFTFEDANYNYKVCPFANITQEETQVNYNSQQFRGVIGVFNGNWQVANYSFEAIEFASGTNCDDHLERSAKLFFKCGSQLGSVIKVAEPKRCAYEVWLETNLVCHEQAMLVYPRIGDNQLKHDWDVIETALISGAIDREAYDKYLNEILVKAEFRQNEKTQKRNRFRKSEEEEYTDLVSCNRAIKEKNELLGMCNKRD